MELISIFNHALMISFFVFVMMLFVDFIDMASKGRMSGIIKGGRWRQYTLASFLGSTPGCLGAFMNVSLYVHGMLPLLSYSLRDSVLITKFLISLLDLPLGVCFLPWVPDKGVDVSGNIDRTGSS